MKTVVGGLLLAVVLFVGAAALWREAKLTRRVAEAHQRLATLQYEVDEDVDGPSSVWNRLPWPIGSAAADMEVHRTTVSYWLSRYDSLEEMLRMTGPEAPTDSRIMFMATNASFRTSSPGGADRKAAINRLEGVAQSYADVLRKDPSHVDAAFNYEFVIKLRDILARAPARGPVKGLPTGGPEAVSVDLPTGPTIHGRPGGPPEGTPMSDFKTVTPMRYEEREEQADPGRGVQFRRKG